MEKMMRTKFQAKLYFVDLRCERNGAWNFKEYDYILIY